MNNNKIKNQEEFNQLIKLTKEVGSVFSGQLNAITDLIGITDVLKSFHSIDTDYNLYCSTKTYDAILSMINSYSFVENILDIQMKSIFVNGVKINAIHNPLIKGFIMVPDLEYFEPKVCVTNI